MSYYQDGYDKGYEDGVEGRDFDIEKYDSILRMLKDGILSVTDAEEEWRKGYADGYEVGREEFKQNN